MRTILEDNIDNCTETGKPCSSHQSTNTELKLVMCNNMLTILNKFVTVEIYMYNFETNKITIQGIVWLWPSRWVCSWLPHLWSTAYSQQTGKHSCNIHVCDTTLAAIYQYDNLLFSYTVSQCDYCFMCYHSQRNWFRQH